MSFQQSDYEVLLALARALWQQAGANENLLTTFIQRIKQQVNPRSGTLMRAFCDRSHPQAFLARGMPDLPRLEERLTWFPHGAPDRPRIGILSSRIGRRPDRRPDWFAALRQLGFMVRSSNGLLVVGRKSAAEKYACHLARRVQLPLCLLQEATSLSQATWMRSILFRASPGQPGLNRPVFLSPPFAERSDSRPVLDRDLAVAAVCHDLYIPHVTRGGRVDRALRAALQLDSPPRVFVNVNPGPLGDNDGVVLLEHGALRWNFESQVCGVDTRPQRTNGNFLTAPVSREWLYLTHCTRERSEPWPEQSQAEYLDAIIGSDVASYSALASLSRILEQSCIRASTRTVPGGTPVVSFTAVPLSRLHSLHTYRSHRVRWDFQPYGICVHARWLQEQGGCPVRYGSAAERNTLEPGAQAFFQVRYSGSRNEIDWSREQEWRVRGDLDLRRLPPRAGLVFVPSIQEACEVAPLSRWPVVLVPSWSKPCEGR